MQQEKSKYITLAYIVIMHTTPKISECQITIIFHFFIPLVCFSFLPVAP